MESESVFFTRKHLEYDPDPTSFSWTYFFIRTSPSTVRMGYSMYLLSFYYALFDFIMPDIYLSLPIIIIYILYSYPIVMSQPTPTIMIINNKFSLSAWGTACPKREATAATGVGG